MIYLYVKRHIDTNLKYFGMTQKKDPFKYKGSGKYWLRHLKIHGNNVETETVICFNNQQYCTEFALNFSKEHNIVESLNWANLIEETGKDNGCPGKKLTPEHIAKIIATRKTNKKTWDRTNSINCLLEHSRKRKGSKLTPEQIAKRTATRKLNGVKVNPVSIVNLNRKNLQP